MPRRLTNWKEAYLEYVDQTEPPDLYKEWSAISVMASALQRKSYIKFGTYVFFPNMYIVLVGPSGKCRKSKAMEPGRDFLYKINVKLAPEATSQVALIGEIEDAIVSGMTGEEGIPIPAHCSLTVYSLELTVFLSYNNPDLLTYLTNWYDCDPHWRYKTQSRGNQIIENVWVNLLGATTPELIASSLPRDTVGGGLASRIIFVYERKKGQTFSLTKMKEPDEVMYENLLHDLQEINLMHGCFKTDEGFDKIFSEWYEEENYQYSVEDPRFSGYTERKPTHIIKLCMILSAAKSSDMIITADIFKEALDLLTRTEVNMPMTFKGVGRSGEAETTVAVMDVIRHRGVISNSELMGMFFHDANRITLRMIVDQLVDMEYCERGTDPDTGKGVLIYKKEQ